MRRNKNAQIVEHIIAYCDDVIHAVERFEGGKEKFATFKNQCVQLREQIQDRPQ